MGKNLLEHINIEYAYGYVAPYVQMSITNPLLCEEFGYVPNLSKYVNCFMKALPEKWQSGKQYTVSDKDFQSISDRFFKDLIVDVRVVRIEEDEEYRQQVSYLAEDSDFIDTEGKLHNPTIIMHYFVYDAYVRDQIRSDFAHEFTHMYENYIRRKDGKESLKQVADRTRYFDYADTSKLTNPKASVRLLKQFLYWTNEQEQNAHISTIKAELEPYAEELQTSRNFEDFLQKSKTYKDYEIIERHVTKLFVEQKIKPETKESMLEAFKLIFPVDSYNINSYDKLVRFCLNRWKKWDMKFKNRLSKIIGSLYESTAPKCMDGPYCTIIDFDKYWEE